MVGGLQIKSRGHQCDGMAAVEVGNRATAVANHAERARSGDKRKINCHRTPVEEVSVLSR